MAGRSDKDVIPVATNNDEFLALISKPGVRDKLESAKFAGHCEPMTAIFKRFKQEFGEKFAIIRVQFVVFFVPYTSYPTKAVADTIDPLEKFRNQSCPTFLFIINRILVKVVRGANAPLIERTIRDHIALEQGGHSHRQIPLDDNVRPITIFLAPNLVETSDNSDSTPSDDNHADPAILPYLHGDVIVIPEISSPISPTDSETMNDAATAEHTFAMLKPDAMNPNIIEEVIALLYHHRFDVINVKKVWLNRDQAAELYKENEKMDYYERLIDYISCAPVLMLELAKENCIQVWRDVVGPRDPKDAKSDAPKSLRALYGQDRLINTFHASDGPVSAARELTFAFGSNITFTTLPYTPPTSSQASSNSGLPQKTLAVIKPNAMLKVEEIISKIVARGYSVVKREEILLHTDRAQELSLEYLETPKFEESVTFLTSEPVLLLTLKGENVIEGWLEMLGPSDPEDARKLYPMSLRAQYGLDFVNNGLHGSQTVELAINQLHSFFPHFINKVASLGSIFKTPMGSRRASEIGSKSNLVQNLRASVAAIEAQRAANKIAVANVVALPVERTLALIKPDAYPAKKGEIMEKICDDGFTVIVEREVQFTKEMAAEFYKEHLGKDFYDELAAWMSGIRALFGTDGSQNAVHGSDSSPSAAREIGVVFGSEISPEPEIQRTLALIKPDVYPAKKNEIVAKMKEDGFTVVKESEVHFDKEKAAEFYKEHLGKGFYEELTTWMSRHLKFHFLFF
ncbi:Thioredoxin domain-containing protein 3 [Physocladia obscura]|uniref:Nucleoside diphosphate kinase n=1 Tax=Physocladia obscura TaxID=109957 RepID=A0AAD5XHV4_9FUNG|nr:Thioredoxin domain-containing protein 3 [Physocladia obscura]